MRAGACSRARTLFASLEHCWTKNHLKSFPGEAQSRCPMPCSRGQADPDRHTTLRLFADSGGYCQRPECPNRLFVDTGTTNIHVAEMAHIIAASGKGPRADAAMSLADKGSYANLILLCANCHTIIDKAPADFPDTMVREWKRKHVERINSLFGAIEYPDRASSRKAIEPALTENRAVFDQYGPNNDYRQDPESDLANVWQRKMRAIILPNNRKVLAILDANRRHLNQLETKTLEAFRQHIDDLEAKHIGDGGGHVASQFPPGMSDIMTEKSYG
jgi:hypothetical protein